MSIPRTASTADLASLNAFFCGANDMSDSGASANVGSRIKLRSKESYAQGVDPNFRSMVKLRMVYDHGDWTETEHCGATVIESRWLVAAAHCTQGKEGDNIKWDRIEVTAGDKNLDGRSTISRVAKEVICHAGFDYAYLANDIVLIRLDEPLPKEIPPMRMDEYRRPSVSAGGIAEAAGWPVTGLGAGRKELQTLALSVKNVEWPGYITVTSPSGRIEGTCRGESGGPLVGIVNGQRQLAGVLSGIETGTENAAGEPCMRAGYEMYYTPIAAYRNWIDEIMDYCNGSRDDCRNGPSAAEFFVGGSGGQPTLASSLRKEFDDELLKVSGSGQMHSGTDISSRRISLSKNTLPEPDSMALLCTSKGGSIGSWGDTKTCEMSDGSSYPLAQLTAFDIFR